MELYIKGVDITASDQSIRCCKYCDYADGHADTLDITFNNLYDEWKGWQLSAGDAIRVKDSVDTGTMFVSKTSLVNGDYSIHAVSNPIATLDLKTSMKENISLKEMIKEVCNDSSMEMCLVDITDYRYVHVERVNMNAVNFLNYLLKREGYLLKIFDKKVIAYNEKKIESSGTDIEITEEGLISNPAFYTSDTFLVSQVSNRYKKVTTKVSCNVPGRKVITSMPVYDKAESVRFSKNLMRESNKYEYTGVLNIDDSRVVAGVMIHLSGDFSIWNGNNFVYQVIHDIVNNEKRVMIRKPIEGDY